MSPRRRLKMLVFTASVLLVVTTIARTTRADPPDVGTPSPVRDAWLQGRLETTYALNENLSAYDIDTQVENGVARLSGTLATDIDRDLALEIAHRIEGIQRVESTLQVDPAARARDPRTADDEERSFSQAIADATISARVKGNLVAHGKTRDLPIGVETRNDVVTLSGSVSSRTEAMLAEMITRNTDGIRSVRNKIRIVSSS